MQPHEPPLTNSDIATLTEWRRELHRRPELSGEEKETAKTVLAMLEECHPDEVLTDLGGHGVAAIFHGAEKGPSVMLRCEIDGLPIEELNPGLPYRSEVAGKGHLCGHDGHMAILAATARWLARNRPRHGCVILLFQPAEENGAGAAAVIQDPRFAKLDIDYAFSLHNFPGLPLGHVLLAPGVMNCASRGMKIELVGKTAHASQPETGTSPAPALAHLISDLGGLGSATDVDDPDFRLVTVTHARMGEPAFGIAPGVAELWVTLRSRTDEGMAALVEHAETAVTMAAASHSLKAAISYQDVFRHCENHPDAVRELTRALDAERVARTDGLLPMRASEDFGRFGDHTKSAMLLLGSGEDRPSLHNPDYDFPDELIPIGASIFIRTLRNLCFGFE
ncbi:amidohydrolase [Lutimaribacter marinistellae]|uniref:Amidohydrolase n=1 Tax=Lutimaribacter marinistellae TaxID=1820329 RepID=A0ABV7TD73_9RHOB